MNMTTQRTGNEQATSFHYAAVAGASSASASAHSCWYCGKTLSKLRSFCSVECREAMYEDNDTARQRRMILGCQC